MYSGANHVGNRTKGNFFEITSRIISRYTETYAILYLVTHFSTINANCVICSALYDVSLGDSVVCLVDYISDNRSICIEKWMLS